MTGYTRKEEIGNREKLKEINTYVLQNWSKLGKNAEVTKLASKKLDAAVKLVKWLERRELPVKKEIYQLLEVGYCKVNVEGDERIKRRAERYEKKVDSYSTKR